MFCEECGKEIQHNWKVCPNCGKKINESIRELEPASTISGKKPRSILKRGWFWEVIAVVVIFISYLVGRNGVHEAEFGRPIIVKDVAYISFNDGTFFDGAVYPFYATDENSGIEYSGDAVMYGIYGVIENLSPHRFDVNDVFDVKLIFDKKYESDAYIWLENEEQTEFLGYDIADQVYLDPDAIINPKDKYHCVLIGQVSKAVYQDAKDAIIEFEIYKDTENLNNCVTYRMPLVIEDN